VQLPDLDNEAAEGKRDDAPLGLDYLGSYEFF
jgi:hypothetical protein